MVYRKLIARSLGVLESIQTAKHLSGIMWMSERRVTRSRPLILLQESQQFQHELMIGMCATPRHCCQEDDEYSQQRKWERL